MKIDLNLYSEFVEKITSKPSNSVDAYIDRVQELASTCDLNVPLALTAAAGMSGEAGEFSEIFKKVLFHGKPFTEETKTHCIKELGDVIWYWTNACRAIGVDPNSVIAENVNKLESRYPGGVFSVAMSETRQVGDI